MLLVQHRTRHFGKRTIGTSCKTVLLGRVRCTSLVSNSVFRTEIVDLLAAVFATIVTLNAVYTSIQLRLHECLVHLELLQYLDLHLTR